jgi:hypothetical protein
MVDNKYKDVNVSDKTLAGMVLTIDDRAYLQRMFCMQDEYTQDFIKKTYDEHASIICGVVRDMIKEQNDAIFAKIDEQNVIIKEIQSVITEIQIELRDHDARIKKLEKQVEKLLKQSKNE